MIARLYVSRNELNARVDPNMNMKCRQSLKCEQLPTMLFYNYILYASVHECWAYMFREKRKAQFTSSKLKKMTCPRYIIFRTQKLDKQYRSR